MFGLSAGVMASIAAAQASKAQTPTTVHNATTA